MKKNKNKISPTPRNSEKNFSNSEFTADFDTSTPNISENNTYQDPALNSAQGAIESPLAPVFKKIFSNTSFVNSVNFTIMLAVLVSMSFYSGYLFNKLYGSSKTGGYVVNDNANPGEVALGEIPAVTDTDHIFGNKNAKIALIEYSDFDCPFCSSFHVTVKEALKNYPDDLMWVYRHLPLENLHPEAFTKAVISECVAKQGGDDAFWAFVDIMLGGENVSLNNMSGVYTRLNLNETEIKNCLASKEFEPKVKSQINEAFAANVKGTPGNVLVNRETGKVMPLRGAVPYATFDSALKSLLAK